MIARVMLLLVALVSAGAQAQEIKESYAFAVLGEPKYAFNFDHFDYVNPAARQSRRTYRSPLRYAFYHFG